MVRIHNLRLQHQRMEAMNHSDGETRSNRDTHRATPISSSRMAFFSLSLVAKVGKSMSDHRMRRARGATPRYCTFFGIYYVWCAQAGRMPCLVSDLTGGMSHQFGLPSLALGQAVSDTGDVYSIVVIWPSKRKAEEG